MNQYDPIRKNLREYSVPVDKEKLWANTSHAIPKKRKRRGVFFWLLGAALLAGSGIMYNAFSPSMSQVQGNEINTSTPATKQTPVTNKILNGKDVTAPLSVGKPASISKNESDHSSAKIIPKSSSTHVPAAKIKTTSKEVHNLEKAGTNKISTPIDLTQQENELMIDDLSTNAHLEYNLNDHIESGAETSNVFPSAENSILHASTEFSQTEEIPTLSLTGLDVLARELSMANPVKVPVKKNKNITLSVMQGYGLSSMDMSATDEEWQPVVSEWQGKIKSLENIETNIEATIRLPKGIQVGVGMQYSILTTQMEYQQTTSEDFKEEGIIAIVIDEDDSQHNLYGDVDVNRQTIIQSTRFTTHNRLNLVSIVSVPVLRSYRSETGIWIKAGYNLSYKSEGTTFSPDGEPLKFSSEDSPYTLQSPFIFVAGIGTSYRINTHWMLNAKAGYEPLWYTHGLYNDQIEFHHSIFSLSLGAGYTF